MQSLQEQKIEEQRLREALEYFEKTSRFTIPDRVEHVRKLQFEEGVEMFAVTIRSIQQAAQYDDVAALRGFIDEGHLNKGDKNGTTAVHMAVEWDSVHVLLELHKQGADLNCRNNLGWSPAHFCVKERNCKMLSRLYDLGSDVHVQDNTGSTPAHYAAQRNYVDILETLYTLQPFPLKPEILDVPGNNGMRPTHVAAQADSLEALDYLWKKGLSLEHRDNYGETPAHKAARLNHTRTIAGILSLTDFQKRNHEEDSAAELMRDKSRFFGESDEDVMTLRDLAKLRRDGKMSHEEFCKLRNSTIDEGASIPEPWRKRLHPMIEEIDQEEVVYEPDPEEEQRLEEAERMVNRHHVLHLLAKEEEKKQQIVRLDDDDEKLDEDEAKKIAKKNKKKKPKKLNKAALLGKVDPDADHPMYDVIPEPIMKSFDDVADKEKRMQKPAFDMFFYRQFQHQFRTFMAENAETFFWGEGIAINEDFVEELVEGLMPRATADVFSVVDEDKDLRIRKKNFCFFFVLMTLVGTRYRVPFQPLQKQWGHQVDGIVRVIFEVFERGRKKVDCPEELEKLGQLAAKGLASALKEMILVVPPLISGEKMTDWVDSVFMNFGAFRQGKMSINEALIPFDYDDPSDPNYWYHKRDFKALRILLKPLELLDSLFSPEDDINSIQVKNDFKRFWIQAAMGRGKRQGMLPAILNLGKGRGEVNIDSAASVFEQNFREQCSAKIAEHIENLRHQFKSRFELPAFSAEWAKGIMLACRRVLIDEGRLKDVFKAIMSIFDVHGDNKLYKKDLKPISVFLQKKDLKRGLAKLLTLYDQDGDGHLSLDECRDLLKKIVIIYCKLADLAVDVLSEAFDSTLSSSRIGKVLEALDCPPEMTKEFFVMKISLVIIEGPDYFPYLDTLFNPAMWTKKKKKKKKAKK